MNKTMKTFGTILACLALTGTCLAAPRGGHPNHHNRGPAPAPMHHTTHGHRHHHMPPPPPPPAVGHHHHGGVAAFGAAVVGGLIGGLICR